MKILNKYILKSFLVPFIATFFIILFVLIMQGLWQQFDKIAGKGISIIIIFKFLGYIALMMVPTALPIAILLSSIMALGNLSENYEFAAVKSAGVSLQRFIRPLILLMLVLSVLNFLFLNNVFPYASLKSKNLVYNMKMKEPGLALVEGTFNTEIPGYSIKFSEKYGENNNLLKDVLIYELKSNNVNNKVITAETGEIISEEGSRYLTLVLKNGFYYEHMLGVKKTYKERKKVPALKAKFDEYKINIDVSSIGNFDPNDIKYKTGKEMLSLNQLKFYSDSLETPYDNFVNNKAKRMYIYTKANLLVADTLKDSDLNPIILNNFDDKQKKIVVDNAVSLIDGNLENVKNSKNTILLKQKVINSYEAEYHRRLAFPLACLVLFFIGTPLGSIIRKGGFGLPMIMAIVIFVIYFFISILGKNMAESGKVSPFIGGWLSTFILLPFGIILMIRATREKGLFNVDTFLLPITSFFNRVFKIKNRKSS